MAKTLVFDTGPLISLTLNNLIWLVEPLQKIYSGDFLITRSVYKELIEKPLSTKKYKFEALQILPNILDGTIKMDKSREINDLALELQDLANSCFHAHGNSIKIVHIGEMEALAAAITRSADAIVIDERTTRTLIESPDLLKGILSKKLHVDIDVNEDNLGRLKQRIGNLPVLRSFELVTIAFEQGLLDRYVPDKNLLNTCSEETECIINNPKTAVLEGVLWGVKLNGCSVKRDDIDAVIDMELHKD